MTVRQKINGFLATPVYLMLFALATALAFIFGLELYYYGLVVAVMIYVCVWGDDLLPLVPMFAFVYVAPSMHNNPGRSTESIFSGSTLYLVIAVGVVLLASIAYRVIRDRKLFFRRGNKLMPGLLALCAAYLLSGIGSQGYFSVAGKNLLFAAAQCAGVLLPYWLLANGVKWEKVRKDYLPWLGVILGCLLLTEIFHIYIDEKIIRPDGVISRGRFYAGWGMRNNIGCMMALPIPFAFSLAIHYKKRFLGILVGGIFLMGVFMTTSRTSMIFGMMGYLGCIYLMCIHGSKGKGRFIPIFVVLGAILLGVVVFHKQLFHMFSQALDDANEVGSRFKIYRNGLKSYLRAPVFGTTFYPGKKMAWGWASKEIRNILPDRWHNTVIQLMASCGTVGIVAYGYHRIQTVRLAMTFRSLEKQMAVLSLVILLLCSLLDCHFFNVGPTLFYSAVLAFLEKQEE